MNPLKFRMPKREQTDVETLKPRPSEIPAWLEAQPTVNIQSTAPLLLNVLKHYNRCDMPAPVRLKAQINLQPLVEKVLSLLRKHYKDESLPLGKSAREQANMSLKILDEVAFAYKIIVSDAITENASDEISINLLVAAMRLAIDHLGQLLLECYSQYTPLPKGLWGELHRIYHLAERNGLHTQVLAEDGKIPDPQATVKHGYLRLVLLALTEPNHLMPGQAATIFGYLEKWTAGCKMLEKKVTIAETGDIFIDLESEQAPTVATGYTRFRPVNGRFLDISPLRAQLAEVRNNMEEKHQQSLRGVPFTIAERLQHNLFTRLTNAWQGRTDRISERRPDGDSQVSLCVGLDAAHHFISEQTEFNPERDETLIHRPEKKIENEGGLSLLSAEETPWELDDPTSKTSDGLDQTRVSRFGEEVDVWNTVQKHAIHARDKREASRAHFQMGPWIRINQSKGGMSLRRVPENTSRLRVGTLVALLDHASSKIWKVGILRWLQDNHNKNFDIGIMILSHMGIPAAVRAIGGAGKGGEYFRTLLVRPIHIEGEKPGLLVPASIYDIGTQLVLNLGTEIKYVRLMSMAETTNSFTLFEYKEIPCPPAEQARIDALGREKGREQQAS